MIVSMFSKVIDDWPELLVELWMSKNKWWKITQYALNFPRKKIPHYGK